MAAARSIASLTLSFGLVSIPIRLYSATEASSAVRFNMLAKDGSRLKQQYVSEKDQKVVPRAEMVKGYEFEKDQFVLFTPDELKKLDEGASHVIEIVSFVPEKSVNPLYYDKPYLLAPDKRGGKPYALLMEAMRSTGKSALAKWSWKGKQFVVQVRPTDDGMVLQQLLYADEVRSFKDLDIEKVAVTAAELKLATQLIDQISEDAYDPTQFKDEEKLRVQAAIDEKIAGHQIVASAHTEAGQPAAGGQVIDLMAALQASLGKKPAASTGGAAAKSAGASNVSPIAPTSAAKKTSKRASVTAAPEAAPRPRQSARKEVILAMAEQTLTLKRVQEMLALSRTVISGLIREGFVTPGRGPRNELRFTFQDLTLLRTAYGLQKARIPPRKILRSLARLRADLPPELPLTGLRITAVGADVVVRDRESQRHAESGQLLIDFDISPTTTGSITLLAGGQTQASNTAADFFRKAVALEQTDTAAAEVAYRAAITLDSQYDDAYLNLGTMLCEAQRCGEAVTLYAEAVRQLPDHPVLHFNHAVALEDQQMPTEALAAYRRALAVDPELADAHFNAARLYQEAGDFQGTLRHFSAYRRLQAGRRE